MCSTNSCPFVDVEGFDSLNGVEVTALLLEDLSFGSDFNPFTPSDDGDLTIGKIADRLAANATVKQEVVSNSGMQSRRDFALHGRGPV